MPLSAEEIASGLNTLGVVGPLVASVIFYGRWRRERAKANDPVVVYMFAIFTIGFALAALQRGYWQLYYVASAAGWGDVYAWMQQNQEISTIVVAAGGIVALLHGRHALEAAIGRCWLGYCTAIGAGTFFVGALIGRIAPG